MNACRSLPDSPEALTVLLNEVKVYVDQIMTLQNMCERLDMWIRVIAQKGTWDPETERFLLAQRHAISQHLASLRYSGTTLAVVPPSGGDRLPAAGSDSSPADADTRDTECRVAEFLSKKPGAKSATIARSIGKSEQRVRSTDAWKANRAQLKEQRAQRSLRTRSLKDTMLAVIPSKSCDPAEIVAEREHEDGITGDDADPENLERQYLEQVDPSEKARYFEMSQNGRRQMLEAWRITGMH
jgi:hypothetical protein